VTHQNQNDIFFQIGKLIQLRVVTQLPDVADAEHGAGGSDLSSTVTCSSLLPLHSAQHNERQMPQQQRDLCPELALSRTQQLNLQVASRALSMFASC